MPSDDDSSRSSQNDHAPNTNNDDDDTINAPTNHANNTTNVSAGTPVALAKSLFDDDDASTASDSDGAPLPPPALASASHVAAPATASIAAVAAGVLDHAPPPLPDSVTPPLPVLGPTPPLPPDRSVPPVLPPVTSPQETLTQTTSTTVARSCSGCALSIAPEEKHYEFRMSDEEVFYHVACFACIDCGMALEPETFKTRGAAVYCATHFAQRFFPRCGGCNEPITTDVFSVALGKSWHKGHFKCFSCGKQLQTDFVADELQRPFCDAECFDEFDDGDDEVEDDNDGDDVN